MCVIANLELLAWVLIQALKDFFLEKFGGKNETEETDCVLPKAQIASIRTDDRSMLELW